MSGMEYPHEIGGGSNEAPGARELPCGEGIIGARIGAERYAPAVNGADSLVAASVPSSRQVPPPLNFRVRSGQREFERGIERYRICGFVCRRQYGKTTTAARIALKKMMRRPGHTVVFGSVKIDLGREIVRKEAEALQKAIRMMAQECEATGSGALSMVDDRGNRVDEFQPDDFAELYEATRLEMRLYHDRTTYSRTKVVALTPDAVGETGDLILDEVGRVKRFREVWEAVKPIISSNPEFRCMLTTTPPPDDSHFSFELLCPPVGLDFEPSPEGNWYKSEHGVHVLRVDAWDAHMDGIPLYADDTGEPLTPEESRARELDKDAWDRNYGVRFVLGGTAAIGVLQLDAAQRRGLGRCRCFLVETEAEMAMAIAWLMSSVGAGLVGVGFDVATTEKATSNPSSLTVMTRADGGLLAPVTLVWKTKLPRIAKARIRAVLQAIALRPDGGRARRLCIDGSNEVYFAMEVQEEMADLVPVELVKGGEVEDQPGKDPITKKARLGNQLVAVFDDNQLTIAPEPYIKLDMRLVKRDRGTFTAELGPSGEHGDTFDSHKLALEALTSTAGGMENVDGCFLGGGKARRSQFRARKWRPGV